MILLVLAGLLLAAWLAAAALLRGDLRPGDFSVWAGAGIGVILAAGVLIAVHISARAERGARDAFAVEPWPTAAPELPSADVESARVAPPVQSLIGPLASRLAAHPEDAEGWALLAQSYAYVGNEERAARAVEQAVALGFDGPRLRERVDAAARSAAHRAPSLGPALGD